MNTPAQVSAVTLTQLLRFCASGTLRHPPLEVVTPETLDRYRLAVESDEEVA